MQITRRYTTAGSDPFASFPFVKRTSRIANPDGSVVFEMKDLLAPESWSQVAVDVLAQKYFRKAGLPRQSQKVPEEGVPEWLQRGVPVAGDPRDGQETDARQVFRRLAGCWTYWGWKGGYFSSESDAQAFHDEVCHMLAAQMAAPNSPQWFNTGLFWDYGIDGPAQGHYRVDPRTKQVVRSTTAYEHPAPHACLPYHAPVTTPAGPIPIGEIVERNLIGLPVFDAKGLTRVVAVKHNGIKAVYRVRLTNGNFIEATADHLVLACHGQKTRQGWYEVGELQPGMRLIEREDASPEWFERGDILSVDRAGGLALAVKPRVGEKHQQPLVLLCEQCIETIEYVGAEDVYDIETESHTFLTNNIVVHNCFIQAIQDDLVNEGGIMDLWVREARIFKYGSGTGSNFSSLRGEGEPLSGGGKSSGLMSFLKIGDRAAGAIKSGGTTRRAAKMVILDLDHPDIEDFINWKVTEEAKVAALVTGSRLLNRHLNAVLKACVNWPNADERLDRQRNHDLRKAIVEARAALVPINYIERVLQLAEQGVTALKIDEYNTDWNSKAYFTVSGQNSNNSVRIANNFMEAVQKDAPWHLYWRTEKEKALAEGRSPKPRKTLRARELWEQIAFAAWSCADPGIQFDTTFNEWHTCPADGRINATNPCSEYAFLDDTACLGPDTRISTPQGLSTVAELYAMQQRGEVVYITTDLYSEHDHRRLTAHRPALVTKVGEKPVFNMILKDGRSIQATADHRFLTDSGEWKRLDELQPGIDRVQIRESGNAVAFTSPQAEVNRWRALGWLTGDGVFSKGNVAMVFGPQETETARFMEEEFNRLIQDASAATKTGLPPRPCHVGTQTNGVLQITSKSEPLVFYLQDNYGMRQGTAIYKDVPAAIHRVSDDLKVAYLQGLFSADGCIRKSATEREVMLASSSPELLRSVQLLLSDLGIVSRITWIHPKGRKNPQGQLHLYNQQGRKFFALVGFPCSAAKQALAKEILSRSFEGALKNPRPVRVVAIEPAGVETVYDITEPVTRSVIAEGIITHNCNLASLNLLRFYDENTGHFDVDSFRHATRLWTLILEISVYMAQFPSVSVARKSYDFRTLGLGYANMGSLLMVQGLPYDSHEGRAWCGSVTALMHAVSYATSAEMAGEVGPFPRFDANREAMLRVIRNHRRAAYNAPKAEYEGLTITPVGIDGRFCPDYLLKAAQCESDRMLELGEKHGYRNAQVSCIAPTGTIALVMDCDTTGIEPDFALVKFKKLAGGGFFK
ncbi:MAG: LAGLIDADG family homing endonuclease, partial [Gemmataceae bacterium]